jgi:hypothetical protein
VERFRALQCALNARLPASERETRRRIFSLMTLTGVNGQFFLNYGSLVLPDLWARRIRC